MRVKVRYFTTLRELAGRAEEELVIKEGSTLADLIEEVASKYGKEAREYLYHRGKLERAYQAVYFLINGKNSKVLSGLKTRLRDGDVVAIIPPIGGGRTRTRSIVLSRKDSLITDAQLFPPTAP